MGDKKLEPNGPASRPVNAGHQHTNAVGLERWLFIGDTHCGHRAGLTPPEYQAGTRLDPLSEFRAELWSWFAEALRPLRPFSGVVWNGDLVDGDGLKCGGSEHIVTDPSEQIDIATAIVEYVGCKKNYFTFGTAYHTGLQSDWEKLIAERVSGVIDGRLMLEINGVVFDVMHHNGRSSVPHGMHRPAKDAMWNKINHAKGQEPKSDVTIRSHAHCARHSGTPHNLELTLPALQGPFSKYGRRCTGDYEMGITWFDFDTTKRGTYSWGWKTASIESSRLEVIKC